jgi:Rieske Fe-S protein
MGSALHILSQASQPFSLEDLVSHPDQFTASQRPGQGMDRRTLIGGAGVIGVGVIGAATLAACGGGNNTAGQTGGSAGSTGSGKLVVRAADIPVGGGTVFATAKVVVTQPKAGEFKAFSAVCTHEGCTVAGVANGTISCPCHASTYDMVTGQVTGGPAPAPEQDHHRQRRLGHDLLTSFSGSGHAKGSAQGRRSGTGRSHLIE